MGTSLLPEDALFGKARKQVLTLLFTHADEGLYVREIIRRTGITQGAIQRELLRLERGGILERATRGHLVYYRPNPGSAIFPELQRLIIKTSGIVQPLKAALRPLTADIQAAFVFGSLARGDLRGDSDVDVFCITSLKFEKVVSALANAERLLQREINPSVMSAAEFRKRARKAEHFVSTVLKAPKILLVGSEDELEKLAGIPVAD